MVFWFYLNWLRMQSEPLGSFPSKLSNRTRGWKGANKKWVLLKGIVSFAAPTFRAGPSSKTHSVPPKLLCLIIRWFCLHPSLLGKGCLQIERSIPYSYALLLRNHLLGTVSFLVHTFHCDYTNVCSMDTHNICTHYLAFRVHLWN